MKTSQKQKKLGNNKKILKANIVRINYVVANNQLANP